MNLTEDEQEAFDIYQSLEKAMAYAYEIAYYRERGVLPEHTEVIRRIDVVNGTLIIIHHAQNRRTQ